MTVTKQQQSEWLARHVEKWKSGYDYAVVEADSDGCLCVRWPSICTSGITKKEWRQERDKMNSKQEVTNSWHERGELPPVGVPVELWWGGSFAYNCEFITRRRHHYIMWNLDADRPDAADYMNSEFRPLRTEREKAIDEIAALVRNGLLSPEMAKEFAVKMYDAGLKVVKR